MTTEEILKVGIEDFMAWGAGLDAAALEREEKALELAFDSLLPVAAAAIAFKQAGEELWVPAKVWDKRWSAFEKSLALAEKTSRWKEVVSIVEELKARSPVLKMYRDYTVKVCGGKDAHLLGMVAWYQANIQKQAWHVWGRVGRVLDRFTMRLALLEGVRTGKGENSKLLEYMAAMLDAMEKEVGEDKKGIDFLVSNEKRKIKKRSATARANPRRGYDDQMEGHWPKFLSGLDRKLEEDKAKPPAQRRGQQRVIEEAIKRHNDASENQITVGCEAVKKRWQRWKKRKSP
jgi:hypothetical protein